MRFTAHGTSTQTQSVLCAGVWHLFSIYLHTQKLNRQCREYETNGCTRGRHVAAINDYLTINMCGAVHATLLLPRFHPDSPKPPVQLCTAII